MTKSTTLAITLLLATLPLCASAPESVSTVAEGDKKIQCEEGWVFSNDFCYYFSEPEDSAYPSDSSHKCLVLDAEFARPETKSELEFLQKEARSRTTYGWLLNLQSYSSRRRGYTSFNVKTNTLLAVTQVKGSVPKLEQSFGKVWKDNKDKCVGLHLEPNLNSPPGISLMSCDLRLRFACQGKRSDFADQTIDYLSWFQYERYVFWVSGELVSRDEANAACKAKSMGLVTSPGGFTSSLNITVDNTPWWTAQVVGDTEITLEDGTPVDAKDVNWLKPKSKLGGVTVLLHSGKSLIKFGSIATLPYICKKRAFVNARYGCSHLWRRAGRSCYFINSRGRKPWKKAKDNCEALGAHLITIDSKNEVLWLQSFALTGGRFMWTSANDRDREGTFTWHDGSAMDTKILPWSKGPRDHAPGEHCMRLSTSTMHISAASCGTERTVSACQYDLPTSTSRCEDNWKQFEGTCYYIDHHNDTPFNNVLYSGECRPKDNGIRPTRLQVKTERVEAFLAKNYKASYPLAVDCWLGMSFHVNTDTWLWEDGTEVDFSIFGKNSEPDNGSGRLPENCVGINSKGQASDRFCRAFNEYICEIELAPLGDAGTRSARAADLALLLCVMFSGFVKHCL